MYSIEEIKKLASEEINKIADYQEVYDKHIMFLNNQLRYCMSFDLSCELEAIDYAKWGKLNEKPIYHSSGKTVYVAQNFKYLYGIISKQ